MACAGSEWLLWGGQISFKTLSEEAAESDQTASMVSLLVEVLAKDTNQSEARVMGWLREGAEFDARQALEAGLIDVISSVPLLPPG